MILSLSVKKSHSTRTSHFLPAFSQFTDVSNGGHTYPLGGVVENVGANQKLFYFADLDRSNNYFNFTDSIDCPNSNKTISYGRARKGDHC